MADLTPANKKKLCILEKLKEEWDLTPKGPVSERAGLASYRVRPGGETQISQPKFYSWMRECDVGDLYEFKNILAGFQEAGLISKFEIFNDYE